MALSEAIEKLKKYYKRFELGKTDKIKPRHVQKVLDKLSAKETSLLEEIEEVKKPSKKKRLEQKLKTTRKQSDRARWLLEEISG